MIAAATGRADGLTGVLVGVLACGALSLSIAAPAAADEETPTAPPSAPADSDEMSSFVEEPDADAFVERFNPEDFIESLGGLQSGDDEGDDGEEEVIVFETDILFSAMEWELPSNAGSKLAELTEEVPEGAAVDVHGHTDSNPVPENYDFDNQVLSTNRAEAVAEVLAEERPDLDLNVEGFGEDQPAVEEDGDDPSTFAANRRVEIRYN